jgi:sugar phosphate isomerase/epimerase
MRLSDGAHLTYCTNVHAGELWPEVRRNLIEHVTAVKAAVCPDQSFGVGLWLSSQAVESLRDREARDDLKRLLAERDLYVFTLNGFPYGAFHARRVKEHVYAPDWRDPRRVAYSDALADLLAELLPEGMQGSVSTLPGGFKPTLAAGSDRAAVADNLLRHAAHLAALHESTGKHITLALEPEPFCMLETIHDAVAFFRDYLQHEGAAQRLAELSGRTRHDAEALIARHLGVCLDACHAAVQFETPGLIIAELRAAAIRVAKVQMSCGLRLPRVDAAARSALRAYLDEVYLHQVVERRDATLTRYLDLPDALQALSIADDTRPPEWRVHFHVPVFLESMGIFHSTQPFLRELLALQRAQAISSHLEVETYTWDVLPREARPVGRSEAIARELRFCLDALGQATPALRASRGRESP